MKISLLLRALASVAATINAADSTPKDNVTAAAKRLGEKASYSWKATVVVPESAQFRPGPTDGKTEKDGFTQVSMSFGDNPIQAVIKGEKAAVTNQDGGWQSLSELDANEGPGRFLTGLIRNFKTPAVQAADLAAAVKELKKDGDVYSGDLTEDGAKAQFRFGTVKNPKGSVKFWLKDGLVTKYEFKLKGTVEFNGNEFESDRTTTVEIKDVGTTKMDVPEAAKKKLS